MSVHTSTTHSLLAGDTTIEISASTATGHVRAVNEDSFVAEFPLFLVADGMGGHDRGDQASQTVAAVLRDRLVADDLPTSEAVLAAIGEANDAVISLTANSPGSGMSGTTLAGIVLVVDDDRLASHWMAFNIGDSRIYSWNGRDLEQLSVDHSAVQELVDAGALTDEAAKVHPDRNIITRAVGARTDVDADVWLLPTTGAQCFVLCSDGLTKELDDDEIARILAANGAAESSGSVSDELIEAALAAGGHDNVTVVVLGAKPVADHEASESTRERAALFEETTPRLELHE
jgi:serine/threonine protein phosphatase PrpC